MSVANGEHDEGGVMDGRRFRTDPDTARTKKRGKHRGVPDEPVHEGVFLSTVATWIPTIYGADRPLVATLLSEDTCWCIAGDDWRARRPSLWQHAARSAWRAEGRLLDEKRARIVEQAAELGFTAPA